TEIPFDFLLPSSFRVHPLFNLRRFLHVLCHQDWRFERFSGSNRFYRQNMKGADCNLDIMPPRKKQNKRSNKLNLKKRTLSKSQKLELKKLEEDMEKELLSAKKI
ncbi:unnamed protein product, partial [Brassica oleracea var. botrytis]